MPTKSLTTISTIADLITNDTLGDTGTSKGIALLDGYQVRFLCSAGAANRKKPRVCQWQKVKP